MFLWSSGKPVFVLAMLVACTMALKHPVGQYWYHKDLPSTVCHHDDSGVGLRHAEVGRDLHRVKAVVLPSFWVDFDFSVDHMLLPAVAKER